MFPQELGTTRGNTWGPVKLPDWESSNETWLCTIAQKDKVLENAKFGVGGVNPAGPSSSEETTRRAKDDIEPLFWHARSAALHEELLHTVQSAATFDLTPGDGLLALKHIDARIPYVGVVLNEKHAEMLMVRLQNEVFHAMSSKNSKLQEMSLINALESAPSPNAESKTKPNKQKPAGAKKEEATTAYLKKIQDAIKNIKSPGGSQPASSKSGGPPATCGGPPTTPKSGGPPTASTPKAGDDDDDEEEGADSQSEVE